MKIYISGPITGTDDYMERFAAAQKKLEDEGWSVVNPALVNSNLPEDTEWEDYMRMAVCMLDMCETVYFLDGWKESRGANIEYKYALGKGKKIMFQEDSNDCIVIAEERPKIGGWIPCSEQLPEEHDSMFAKLKGTDKWNNAMFEKISDDVNVTVKFEDGNRKTMTLHTIDGKWKTDMRIVKFEVIAWQPLPEPYRGEDRNE